MVLPGTAMAQKQSFRTDRRKKCPKRMGGVLAQIGCPGWKNRDLVTELEQESEDCQEIVWFLYRIGAVGGSVLVSAGSGEDGGFVRKSGFCTGKREMEGLEPGKEREIGRRGAA